MANPALDNLNAAYLNATARLAELDALPVDQRVKMTYSVGERTYGWNEYRASLMAQITAYPEQVTGLLKAQQAAAGPFQVHSPW